MRIPKGWHKWLLMGCALLLLAAGVTAVWLRRSLSSPYKGFPEPEKLFLINPGTRSETIVSALRADGILEKKLPALVYLWWNRDRGGIKAGEYQFQKALTVVEVVEKLMEGRVYQHSITIPEGLPLWEVAALLQSKGLETREEALVAMHNTDSVRDLDPVAPDLEGYLFPDTYFFIRGTHAQDLVGRMVGRFKEIFKESWRARAAELGLGIRGAVTLASLIEKETAVDEERPLVSAVFHRRLAQRMPLECDPTVIYASLLMGKFDGTIRRSDLSLQSPYNTYTREGLPPGPIASPGARSLEAALYPAPVTYLYFVAKNDGTHQFSETLAAHNRAVRAYQR